MLSWTLYRLFGTLTHSLYIPILLGLDFDTALSHTQNPWMWLLTTLLAFRHGILGMTIGYHRYYSHAAFKAKRWVEFLIAYSCVASNQGGISWWAGNHRHHHNNCDTPEDPHSPIVRSKLYAWLGWTFDLRNARHKIRLHYPEVIWLDRWGFVVPWLEWGLLWLASGSLAFATWTGLAAPWFALITTLWFNVRAHEGIPDEKGCAATTYKFSPAYLLGEWEHRDHHNFPGKAHRPEIDLPYWLVLYPLEKLGLIWDLRET